MVRIVAGAWRGRSLAAPASQTTRPTADRVRQALFDMLSHAPWAQPWGACTVLDAFAGTGALGLEALSRGASAAVFFEADAAAQRVLRSNIAALAAGSRAIVHGDATRPPPAGRDGGRTLIFLDPPYGRGLVGHGLAALKQSGWIAADALIVAETARDEAVPVAPASLLAERSHGAARISIWRTTDEGRDSAHRSASRLDPAKGSPFETS